MAPKDMEKKEIQAEVLWKLKRRKCWGRKYLPVDSLVSWIGNLVKDNGKSVRRAIEDLIKKGILIPHKKGDTVSLNTRAKKEIYQILNEFA